MFPCGCLVILFQEHHHEKSSSSSATPNEADSGKDDLQADLEKLMEDEGFVNEDGHVEVQLEEQTVQGNVNNTEKNADKPTTQISNNQDGVQQEEEQTAHTPDEQTLESPAINTDLSGQNTPGGIAENHGPSNPADKHQQLDQNSSGQATGKDVGQKSNQNSAPVAC